MRVGQGYDVHKFGVGDHIILGGVKIPHTQGLIAHSDGDVLLHALCDAMLGAAALGDIGQHFPDSDPSFKNADSRQLTKTVVGLLQQHGFGVVNADMTIIAQAPKMSPWITKMRTLIAHDLRVDVSAINVKATTTEKLGFIGREEGLACQAVVLLQAQ